MQHLGKGLCSSNESPSRCQIRPASIELCDVHPHCRKGACLKCACSITTSICLQKEQERICKNDHAFTRNSVMEKVSKNLQIALD